MGVCAECGRRNDEDAAFCSGCGTKLASTEPYETRKRVTLVFSDVAGSTALGEGRDPESIRSAMTRYFSQMREIVEFHGGTIEKFVGDAVMAAFGVPIVHDDDAIRAVRAAWEMRAATQLLNEELERELGFRLQVRTGVNTGEVVAGDAATRQTFVTGDTVNTAARLEQNAPPGEIYLGPETYLLVRETVTAEAITPLTLKGKAEPLPAWRLLSFGTDTASAPQRQEAPLVGRARELGMLLDAYREASYGNLVRVLMLGTPGVGKSRLASELMARCAGSKVLRGRCLPYGGATFTPIIPAIRAAADISPDDLSNEVLRKLGALLSDDEEAVQVARHVGAVLGIDENISSLEESFWGLRRCLEGAAAAGPVMLVIEDMHWGDDVFLRFLDHVSEFASGVPLFLLCTSRLDLLDEHPEWEKETHGPVVRLTPLEDQENASLIRGLLRGGTLESAVEQPLARSTAGNPLFARQAIAMLRERGTLRLEDGRWVLDGTLDVPPQVSAVIAARLDRLRHTERRIVEGAAIIGERFRAEELEALEVVGDEPAALPELIDTLISAEFFQRPSGADGLAFVHALVRDEAYGGVTKRRRAALHERYAQWIEARSEPIVAEVAGYHFEQAYRYRSELAPLNDVTRALGARAAGMLGRAATRSSLLGDVEGAATLLHRALAAAPEDDPRRCGWLTELGAALREEARFTQGIAALEEAIALARANGDVSAMCRATVERFEVDMKLYTPGWVAGAADAARWLVPALEEIGDDGALAKVWRMLSWVSGMGNDPSGWDEASWRSIEHARRAGDRREEVEVMAGLAVTAVIGPKPIHEGIQLCRDILREVKGNKRAEAFVLMGLALLEAGSGSFAKARASVDRSLTIMREIGASVHLPSGIEVAATIEQLAGDPVAAEECIRSGLEFIEEHGDLDQSAYLKGRLAVSLSDQGRHQEALELARRALPACHLSRDRVVCLGAIGMSSVRLGDVEAGLQQLREASAEAAELHDLMIEADLLQVLGEGFLLAGRHAEARRALDDALRSCEQKGYSAREAHVRTVLAR
ncbi:MAG: adenylate/guanylate cyclase domain-containing protein, partial [Gaiellaceae bacterium]